MLLVFMVHLLELHEVLEKRANKAHTSHPLRLRLGGALCAEEVIVTICFWGRQSMSASLSLDRAWASKAGPLKLN